MLFRVGFNLGVNGTVGPRRPILLFADFDYSPCLGGLPGGILEPITRLEEKYARVIQTP